MLSTRARSRPPASAGRSSRAAAARSGAADAHRRAAGAARRPAGRRAARAAAGQRHRPDVLGCRAGARRPAAPAQLPALQRARARSCRGGARPSPHGIREYAFRHQILHQVTYDTRAQAGEAPGARTHRRLAGAPRPARRQEPARRRGRALRAGRRRRQRRRVLRPRGRAHGRHFVHDAAVGSRDAGAGVAARRRRRAALAAARPRASARCDCWGGASAQLADIDALQALAEAMPPGAEGDAATRRGRLAPGRHRAPHRRLGDAGARGTAHAWRSPSAPAIERLALRAIQRLAQALAFRGDPAAGRALAEAGAGARPGARARRG